MDTSDLNKEEFEILQNFISVNPDPSKYVPDNSLGYILFMVSKKVKRFFFDIANHYYLLKNHERAFFWHNIGTIHGNYLCQYLLAKYFERGIYTSSFVIHPNYDLMEKYMRSSAQNGLFRAQIDLARKYEKGNKVKQNYYAALHLYKKCEKKGCNYATSTIGLFYQEGHGGLPVDIEEAYRRYKLTADNGYHWGFYKIANMYEIGQKFEKNLELAFYNYQKAIEHGSFLARKHLAHWYLNGYHVEKNISEAINLLTQCANRNCNQSCIVLGQIYSGKYGTYNDPEKAALWYKKANEIFQQEE